MLEKALSALANKYRRRLLVALVEHNPQDEVSVLEGVHTGEKGRERLKAEMYHIHLPKLEESGLIQWDGETLTVSRGPQFEQVRPVLESIDTHSDPEADGWN